MSTINTNGLNVNYPVPGINNNSQGFRNNFTNIKQNLDVAALEITDLQTSVVVKNALGNAAIDNDMANVLISNASTLNFRSTTYNLGGSVTGSVLIDLGIADVHYGTLGGNVQLIFGNWAPTGTLSKVILDISTSNVEANYSIAFPSEVIISSDDFGTPLINNFIDDNGTPTLTFPHNCTELILQCYSQDCGNTIYITPINRPFQSVQIQSRSPGPTGLQGDVPGTVAVDANYLYVCTGYFDSNGANSIYVTNTISTTAAGNTINFAGSLPVGVVVDMPVIFDTMKINGNSVTTFGNINAGQTYYVKTIPTGNTSITVSETRDAGVAGDTLELTTVTANSGQTSMDATFYAGSNIWKRIELTSW
jgi:hypothetical protein